MTKLDINWLSDDGKYQYAIDCMQLEIDRLQDRIDKAIEYIKVCKNNDMGIRYQRIEEILQGSDK